MSDLIAVNFDCISSPNIKLTLEGSGPSISGWGFGWYPSDDYAASVVKDAGVKSAESMTSALSDWRRFRSTTFLCKIRGAVKKPSQQDTQPFQRSFWGKDWLFLHNGSLDRDRFKSLVGETEGFLQPLGGTDSELAFCFLLQHFQNAQIKRIADIDPHDSLHWFSQLDDLGSGDFVLSDGQSLLVFHGKNSDHALFFSRLTPPHPKDTRVIGDGVDIDFEDPRDVYRSIFLVSSSQLDGTEWTEMAPGQLLTVRRANILFNTHGDVDKSASSSSRPPTSKTQQKDVQARPDNVPTGLQDEQEHTTPTVTNIKSIVHASDGTLLEYRLFNVSHVTEYTYEKEVERSTHTLRLQPVEDTIQEVIRSTLYFSVNSEKLFFEDVFGNHSIHVTIEQPYTKLSVHVESQVKIYASPADDFRSSMRKTSIPLVWMPWQRQMMLPYLLPPELPETQLLELTDFAMSFVERADYSLIDTITEMNQHIYKDFRYVQGATDFHTTPFDVYSSRKGVCQDFANLLICLARLLNIPSRYRVGYIYTGANYENKVQSEASHAWVEVYLPYLGWRGFDPTNGCIVGQEHIRVACGRNYIDAAPTAGTLFKGGGGETLSVNVKVVDMAASSTSAG